MKRSRAGWYKMKYNATLRVENTPGGKLARMIREKMMKDEQVRKMKIMVIEKNGPQLAKMVNFVDPYKPDFCSREKCFPCATANKPTRGTCWTQGALYQIQCLACEAKGVRGVYWGESGHSSHFRGRQHWDKFLKGKQDSVLLQHNAAYHPGKPRDIRQFQMETVATYPRPIVRQSREGCGDLRARAV